jgi:predicted small lipoprotein YifL
MSLARSALALVLLLTMLGSAAGCGRKAIPEPRKSERSSTATLFVAR